MKGTRSRDSALALAHKCLKLDEDQFGGRSVTKFYWKNENRKNDAVRKRGRDQLAQASQEREQAQVNLQGDEKESKQFSEKEVKNGKVMETRKEPKEVQLPVKLQVETGSREEESEVENVTGMISSNLALLPLQFMLFILIMNIF